MTAYIFDKNCNPTGLGGCIELVRQSGNYNMIMDFNKALTSAYCIAIYLDMDFEIGLGKEQELFTEYIRLWSNEDYARKVKSVADSFPYSNNYQHTCEKYNHLKPAVPTLKMLVEKAEEECLNAGKYGRDKFRIKNLQTTKRNYLIWGGIQLLHSGLNCI